MPRKEGSTTDTTTPATDVKTGGDNQTTDWKTARASVNGHLEAVTKELQIDEPDQPGENESDKRFGKNINEGAQTGADLMEAFGDLDFEGKGLRDQEERARELRTAEAAIRQTADAVGAKAQKVENRLSVMTGQVLDTVKAIQLKPGLFRRICGRILAQEEGPVCDIGPLRGRERREIPASFS